MNFSLDSTEGTNEGVVEGVDYIVHTDKNGTQTRVLNFKNEKICRRTGIIELEPVKRSSRHENYLSFSRIYDEKNNIVIGIPNGVDPKTGELRFKRIVLREEQIFDLSNEQEALTWAVVSRHRKVDVDGYKTKMGMKPLYKVYDKEKEAEEFMATRNIKRKAEAFAESLAGVELRDFAISIGIPADNMSATQQAMEVIKYAEKNPKQFVDAYLNPNRHQLTVIKKGLSIGVLTQDPMHGICYNALPLGISEQQAVEYLKNNIGTCNVIEQLIASKEGKVIGTAKKTLPVIADEKDAELARLKKQLAEAEKRNADLANQNLNAIVEKTSEQILTTDDEHKQLIAKAKELKIKSPHLYKKDVLIEKIKEAEQQVKN